MLQGALRKLSFAAGSPIRYALRMGEQTLHLNGCLGEGLRLSWAGEALCSGCGKAVPKRYGGSYCYPCFKRLARCDLCVMSPTRCHHHLGTCREPAWGEEHCMTPHTVYLANSSGVKVGLTRGETAVNRWVEQGATQGLAIARANTRRAAGELEALLAEYVPEHTDWRALVTSPARPVALDAVADRLIERARERAKRISGIQWLACRESATFTYPVLRHARKAVRLTLGAGAGDNVVEGRLCGIVGQYLLFEHGAFNVAKHVGCVVRVDRCAGAAVTPQMELFEAATPLAAGGNA